MELKKYFNIAFWIFIGLLLVFSILMFYADKPHQGEYFAYLFSTIFLVVIIAFIPFIIPHIILVRYFKDYKIKTFFSSILLPPILGGLGSLIYYLILYGISGGSEFNALMLPFGIIIGILISVYLFVVYIVKLKTS